jgi:DNA-binding transcriptional regulator LsrR (DeoR family)
MLTRARQSGLVRISIDFPDDIDASVSHRLATAYSLRHAFVVDTDDRDDAVIEPLGRAGARLLEEIVEPGETLGIAMGQTLGSLTGAAFPIYAPLYVSSPDVAAELRSQTSVREALEQHDRLGTAVVAIGSWSPPYSTVYNNVSEYDRTRLAEQGAVAELCTTLIDGKGRIISSPLSDRLISISATQLAAVPTVLAVAGGPSKHHAIAAALTSGIINALVTDINTAHYLLQRRSTGERTVRVGQQSQPMTCIEGAVEPLGDPGSRDELRAPSRRDDRQMIGAHA